MTTKHEGSWTEMLERRAFRALNAVVRPPIQRGVGSPCLTPWGLVVLEHTGRRTGRQYASPLFALRMGRLVVVTTYRTGGSHWIRNLEDRPSTYLWMNGRRTPYRARVLGAGGRDDDGSIEGSLEPPLRRFVRALVAGGFAVSVLEPV